ncbi:MAG: hypothetical protein WCK42_07725 [Myxococcaceae bacterium]
MSSIEVKKQNNSELLVSQCKKTRRYKLSELLEGVSKVSAQMLNSATCWAREGVMIGKELA